MIDKGIVAHHMLIPHLLRTVAEVILLPVTPPKGFRVKEPHFLDDLPLDIHTEAHSHGDFWITPQAAPLNQGCILINGHMLRHRIVLTHDGYRTERGAVGQRRYSGIAH